MIKLISNVFPAIKQSIGLRYTLNLKMKHWWTGRKFCVGVLSSAVFLTLALQQVDWARTAATLRDANWVLASLGIGAAVATLVTFAFRWRVLLSSTAELPVKDTFSYIMIGHLANTVFPLRMGEVARAVLLGKRYRISASLVFGSVVLERTLDVLTILMLALGVSLIMDIPPAVRAGMMTLAGAGLVALGALLFLARSGNRVLGWVGRLSGFAPGILPERLAMLVERFAGGLGTLRDGRELGLVLCLSVLAWAIAGTATIFYIAAFQLHVPWYAGFFVLTVTNLGSAIPSSPGFIGVYHYLAVLALSVWVPDKSEALGYAIGTHGITMLTNILIGCTCLAREGIALQSIGAMGHVVQETIVSQKEDGKSVFLPQPSPSDGSP
jgi:glycosyltransferase 2 family protein